MTTLDQQEIDMTGSSPARSVARSAVLRGGALLLGGVLAASAVLAGASAAVAQTVNPILSDGSYYSADPATLVADDTLYIFAGRDEAGPTQNDFIMNEWQTFSTTDVESGQWEHQPAVMRPEEAFDWATPGRAYAGQAVEGTDGRYYWYVPVSQRDPQSENAFAIGVAVADSPTGPWTDAIGGPLLSQRILGNDIENIDPTVLVDDDGRVYLYWGTFGQLRAIELDPSMTSLIGEPVTVTGARGFFEAPWLFKRGETYYLAYAGNEVSPSCTEAVYHACISYATSPGPMGPWTYTGRVLAPVSSTTSHPAITEFDGSWYIAYHTADAEGGNHFRRSVAIDEVLWDDSVSPARMLEVVQTPEKTVDRTPRANVAPWATASSSNQPVPAQYWIRALNNELVRPNPLPPDMWGNYSGNRPASEWVQYDWEEPVRIDSTTVDFWRDAAPGLGDGVSNPASWVLQYRGANGEWADVVDPTGYGTSTDEPVTVGFAPVTTTAVRLTMQAAPGTADPSRYSAVAIEEWRVDAQQPASVSEPLIETASGTAPVLPATVDLTMPDGEVVPAPVIWDEVDPVDWSRPGTFEVAGFVEGYAAGTVAATVTVTGDPDPGTDTTAPTVALSTTPVEPASGWFRTAPVVRASATDERDLRLTIELRVNGGEWQATPNARFADLPVSAEGETAVEARAVDAAGNVSTVASTTVRFDRTAPVVTSAVSLADRTVSLAATDATSGVAGLEYSIGDRASWQPYEAPVVAGPESVRVFHRATDTAGNVSMVGSVTVPADDDSPLEGNVAPLATASASYTSPWTQVAWVNDGDATAEAPGWGTWPEVGEQWVELQWPRVVSVDRAAVSFFTDQDESANAGVIVPESWRIQYYDFTVGDWRDVVAQGEYGRDRVAANAVAFEKVTTDRLRVTMQAWGETPTTGSSGLREIEVFAAAPDPDPEPEPTVVDRIAGADRYEVAVNTSKAGFASGSSTVYVASGAVFPDALSAAPAAAVAGAPILLTTTADLPAGVAAEIKRLGATKIVIVGGTATVSANVEASLAKLGTVTRIGGADRYEASRNIAKAAFPSGAPTAVLSAGTTFADALSAGAAIDGEGPVILVKGSSGSLDAATKKLLADLDVKSIAIAGGEASVSAGIQTDAAAIADTIRLGGADRYEASRSINDHFFDTADHVLLATGLKFSDALSGSAYGPRIDAPLFTVKADCIPAATLAQIEELGATKVTLLGGPASLSAAVEDLVACTP
jgi:putative cell wall-binding protein